MGLGQLRMGARQAKNAPLGITTGISWLKIHGVPGYCVWTSLQSTHLTLVNIASSKKIMSRMWCFVWCSTNCATCNILKLSLSSLHVSSCTSSRCGSFLCQPWNKNFHFYKSSFHREPLSELAWQFFPSSLFPCLLHLHSLLVSRTDCRVQPVGFLWEILIDLTFLWRPSSEEEEPTWGKPRWQWGKGKWVGHISVEYSSCPLIRFWLRTNIQLSILHWLS